MVHPPRSPAGAARDLPPHAALRGGARPPERSAESLETHRESGIDVLVAAVKWPRYVEGISNLAHKLVDLTDCQALALLVEMDRRVFCVVRSRTPSFDAGKAATALGGGGHPQAASAIGRGTLGKARKALLGGIAGAVGEPVIARDVMARPVRSVAPDETVAKAMVVCQRHGQSGILVARAGTWSGPCVARTSTRRSATASPMLP